MSLSMDPIDNGEILVILLGQCIDSWWIGTSLASFFQYWNTEPYHPSFTLKGSSSGRKATQKIPKWSLKLIRYTRLLPWQRARKAESPSQMKGSWAAKKSLKKANLIPAVWKTFRPTEAPGKDILYLLSHPQAVQFLQVPSSLSCHPCCVGFGDEVVFESFLLL